MMRAVVVVACLASAGIIAVYTRYFGGDAGEPVYTVPARAPDPSPHTTASAAASRPIDRPIDPTDRAALARALQRELKRVGCYNGEVSGVWTTSSRMAMRTFNERVNATLPVDTPDPVLLSLVQGHRERACGAACPAGQTAVGSGACLPEAVAANAGKPPAGSGAEAERTADVPPAAAGAASAGAAAVVPAAATGKVDPSKSKGSAPGAPRPAAGGPGGPVPSEGMTRESRPRRTAEAPPPRPPKIVRDVLRALGF
jgi:hypothetical protein